MLSGFWGCERRAQDTGATRAALEAAALAKLKSETAKFTAWAAERRPKRVWPPLVAAEWKFVTELEKRLKSMADQNLPDDLEEALEEYVHAFQAHPDLVEPKSRPRALIFDVYGRQLNAFDAEIRPARERLRATGEKYGVDFGSLVEEW